MTDMGTETVRVNRPLKNAVIANIQPVNVLVNFSVRWLSSCKWDSEYRLVHICRIHVFSCEQALTTNIVQVVLSCVYTRVRIAEYLVLKYSGPSLGRSPPFYGQISSKNWWALKGGWFYCTCDVRKELRSDVRKELRSDVRRDLRRRREAGQQHRITERIKHWTMWLFLSLRWWRPRV